MSDEIKGLKSEIKQLSGIISRQTDEIEELTDEISGLEERIDELQKDFSLEGIHANLRTQTAIEELFDNLDYIPITELETFVNTHKKI